MAHRLETVRCFAGSGKGGMLFKGNALIPDFTGYNTGPRYSFADRSVAQEINSCVTLVGQPVASGDAKIRQPVELPLP